MVDAGAAMAANGRAQQAEGAHLVHDLAVEALVPVRLHDARQQFLPGVGAGAVAHQPLILAELIVEQERIVPLEERLRAGRRGLGGRGGLAHDSLLDDAPF